MEQTGIESYCPVKAVKRKWSDRIKTIEEPLFKSCVFVKIVPEQKTTVRLTEGVVNFLYKDGKLALVKEKELKALKKLLREGKNMACAERNNGASWQKETGVKQRKTLQMYLDDFSNRLNPFMDRPKLA